jgi:hypothetical protein
MPMATATPLILVLVLRAGKRRLTTTGTVEIWTRETQQWNKAIETSNRYMTDFSVGAFVSMH